MRNLRRNQREFYYALYEGSEDAKDEWGNLTGEQSPVYSAPVKAAANISAAVGESAVEAFGNLTDYSRVLCGDFPLDENTRIWFGVSPEDGFPHNYVVVRKADSLNGTLFALREVKVDG